MIIRKYKDRDRKSIERIHFETGFLGKSMDALIEDHKYWDDEIAFYFSKEADNIFVLEKDDNVVGYLLGCLDDSKHNEALFMIIKNLKNLFNFISMSKKDKAFWKSELSYIWDAIIGKNKDAKFKIPKTKGKNKIGHLHINLLPVARAKGYGSKLINKFIECCKENNVKLIHADSFETKLNPNKTFWKKNGFEEYLKIKTAFWKKHLPDENINLICYTRKIE